jgi:hypothetical protein
MNQALPWALTTMPSADFCLLINGIAVADASILSASRDALCVPPEWLVFDPSRIGTPGIIYRSPTGFTEGSSLNAMRADLPG